jgi:hypothetical protein
MDYEEQWEELERVQPCEECDFHKENITKLILRLRESEDGSGREYNKRKMRLTWAVEAQERHQREHGFEEEPIED